MTNAIIGMLLVAETYLVVAGIGALIVGARTGRVAALLVASNLIALSVVVWGSREQRWYWRVLSGLVPLTAVLGIETLVVQPAH